MTENFPYNFYAKMSHTLANKYKDKSQRDDLYAIGLLKAWEHRHKPKDTIIGHMRRAMHDHYTLKRSPLSIPSGTHSRDAYRAMSTEGYAPSTDTEKALYDATQGVSEPIEPNTSRSEESTEDIYIKKELTERLHECIAQGATTKKRGLVLKLLYVEGYTPSEVISMIQISEKNLKSLKARGINDFKRFIKVE